MIPIIESEIVEKRKWISKDEFVDLIAVAQSCPGVFAINLSTFIGYKIKRVPGAICIILLIALFFHSFQDNPVVESIFKGIRPAVVALIAVPTWNMALSAKVSWTNCWIPILSALLIWAMGVNPIFIILAAGIGGFLYGQFIKPTE